MARQPQARLVRKVVKHLQELGLFVYGPCTDLETGIIFGANMDFDAEQILKFRRIVNKGGPWHDTSEDDPED